MPDAKTRVAENIRLKRIYDPPSEDDGYRVLSTRYWPRGVPKAAVNEYTTKTAPSRLHQCFPGREAHATEFLVRIEQQDAVFRHDADHHDQSHERRDIERRARDQQGEEDARGRKHRRR